MLNFQRYFPVGYKSTTNGVTAEVLADGRVHVYGKHTETGYTNVIEGVLLDFDRKRVYPQGTYTTGINFTVAFDRNGRWDNKTGSFTLSHSSAIIGFFISVKEQQTFDFYVVPALVVGEKTPTTYPKYIMETNTLTLPETVYGGEVDAVSGSAMRTWKYLTLTADMDWGLDERNKTIACPLPQKDYATYTKGKCSHLHYLYDFASGPIFVAFNYITLGRNESKKWTIETWKDYLAAQTAAGTPVQIAYNLAKPVPFTATGAQPIPAIAGANTVLTDADSATVTGRADPIKRITDLEDAVASQT